MDGPHANSANKYSCSDKIWSTQSFPALAQKFTEPPNLPYLPQRYDLPTNRPLDKNIKSFGPIFTFYQFSWEHFKSQYKMNIVIKQMKRMIIGAEN